MSIISHVFGDANDKYLKKLQPIIDKINALEENTERLSLEELKNKTAELRERIKKGETLEDMLPEVFALVREAAKRNLNQRHFDVQLLGGIVLHNGQIAEMKTGEGKTLSSTLAVYLNALEGKGAHVITVNDYLAKRDTVWMGQIYYALGMSVGCIVHETAYIYDPEYLTEEQSIALKADEDKRDEKRDITGGFRVEKTYLRPVTRKEAYAADITYGTNNEFGFDYLRDNMVYDLSQQSQRGHHFVIIDEVDSVLIDEARTPLIISAPDMESSKFYSEFSKITPNLKDKEDYEIDEKSRTVSLTEAGVNHVEKILGMGNIYEEKGMKYLRYLEQALRAQTLFKKDKDYVVKNGEVIIVDEFTGRLMPGRRWSQGLHQAIEAKEGVFVRPESLTLASVTFQNYFRLYKKLAGMTGTAATSAEELDKVYKLEVRIIPTNNTLIRNDFPDKVFKTQEGKLNAVISEIKEKHEIGQPILVGTTSIEKNEYLGKILEKEGIPHQLLNAKNHEKEGEIIAQAGKFGQVTLATNMAGRGVDIVLGGNPPLAEEAKKVKEVGGLYVIGTERHEARRIDNQLRGRSGRQGDPGVTQFFLSLEDDLLRVFGGDKIKSLMTMLKVPEDQPIEAKLLSGSIESAQSKIEGMNFDVRKHVLEYDDVMSKQREVIYKKRREFLGKNEEEMKEYFFEIIQKAGYTKEDYEKKRKEMGENRVFQAERVIGLRILDMCWLEHLENMDYLRDSVRLRAYGQRDPLVEYKSEGHKMFQELVSKIETAITSTIFKIKIEEQPVMPQQPAPAISSVKSPQIGRNDPCPCGSGKKFKKCCGK